MPKSGDNLDMETNAIVNLKDPVLLQDGVTKFYADSGVSAHSGLTQGIHGIPDTSLLATISGAQTLANKRNVLRIEALPDISTITPHTDSFDGGTVVALSQAATFEPPTGTPTLFQTYILRLTSLSPQGLSWITTAGGYRSGTLQAFPSSTIGGGKTEYYGFQWNEVVTVWDFIAYNFGF